jgi:guanosine-3',5'-bis(diphosphate) 3'-pyrophosphohydrolase
MSPNDHPTAFLARAYAFAAVRHAGQKRNAAGDEPYLHHLIEVANLLAYATDGADPVLVAGGVLHDVLEDTPTAPGELSSLFGPEVTALVAEVTDPGGVTEAERRQRQVEHAPHLSDRARLLKIADKTSNIRERLVTRPPGKTDQEIRDYVDWGAAVVAGCRGLNEKLEDAFDEAYEAAMRKYGA